MTEPQLHSNPLPTNQVVIRNEIDINRLNDSISKIKIHFRDEVSDAAKLRILDAVMHTCSDSIEEISIQNINCGIFDDEQTYTFPNVERLRIENIFGYDTRHLPPLMLPKIKEIYFGEDVLQTNTEFGFEFSIIEKISIAYCARDMISVLRESNVESVKHIEVIEIDMHCEEFLGAVFDLFKNMRYLFIYLFIYPFFNM